MGWMDGQEAQWKRFEVLVGSSVDTGESLLDLGCGVGHLVDYLIEKGLEDLTGLYHGCDPHAAAVDRARLRHPEHRFDVGDLFSVRAPSGDKWDWILMSGIFNIEVPREEMRRTVAEACARAAKGIAFNLLLAPYPYEEYAAYDPEEVCEWIRHELGPQCADVEVVRDYGVADEFTLRARVPGSHSPLT